uniref:Uncharacterized protein n=1 Tax=Arundo donax TaxID=35708 RepID=A0A0A9GRK7_ARUDO
MILIERKYHRGNPTTPFRVAFL